MAKVIMPVGAVKGKTARGSYFVITIKHDVGDVRKVVIGVQSGRTTTHFGVAKLTPDIKNPGWGFTPFTGRDKKTVNEIFAFVGIEGLISKIDVDLFVDIRVTKNLLGDGNLSKFFGDQ